MLYFLLPCQTGEIDKLEHWTSEIDVASWNYAKAKWKFRFPSSSLDTQRNRMCLHNHTCVPFRWPNDEMLLRNQITSLSESGNIEKMMYFLTKANTCCFDIYLFAYSSFVEKGHVAIALPLLKKGLEHYPDNQVSNAIKKLPAMDGIFRYIDERQTLTNTDYLRFYWLFDKKLVDISSKARGGLIFYYRTCFATWWNYHWRWKITPQWFSVQRNCCVKIPMSFSRWYFLVGPKPLWVILRCQKKHSHAAYCWHNKPKTRKVLKR